MKCKVNFSDGSFEVQEDDYEYQCLTKRGKLKKVSIKEMLKVGLRCNKGNLDRHPAYRFKIPIQGALEYEELNYSIDPYVIGCLLGDGCCTGTVLTVSSDSDAIPNEIAKLIGASEAVRTSIKNYNWVFRLPHKIGTVKNFQTKVFLKDFLNELAVKTQYKRIPSIYKQGSIQQRFNLLQGLLDTDGTIDKTKGRVSFESININLIRDVQEVCASLGFITGISIDKRIDKYCTKACFHLSIQCKIEDKINLFRLPRKKQIALDLAAKGRKQNKYNNKRIVAIEYEV